MNLFKKKEKNNESLFISAEDIENTTHFIKNAPIHWLRPNDDIEFIIPQFNAQKYYKHLKKMMWKNKKYYI